MSLLVNNVQEKLKINHKEAFLRVIGMFIIGFLFVAVLILTLTFFPWKEVAPQNFSVPFDNCIQLQGAESSYIKLVGKSDFISLAKNRQIFVYLDGLEMNYYLPQEGILLVFTDTIERGSDIRYGIADFKINGNQITLSYDRWCGWTIFLLIVLPVFIEFILFCIFGYLQQRNSGYYLFFSS